MRFWSSVVCSSVLLQRVAIQLAGTRMVLVGEDRMIEQRCRPTVVTIVEGGSGELDHPVDTAARRHVARDQRLRRVPPEPAGVTLQVRKDEGRGRGSQYVCVNVGGV